MFKVGKLYHCEEFFLLLYPDPETAIIAAARTSAATAATPARSAAAAAEGLATYWSNRFKKPVYYTEKKVPLLVLNNREKYVEVLAGDRKGWIIYQDWLGIKEISNENIS